jgi:photosystem II stability/assembly factor-like uncharacterized protein
MKHVLLPILLLCTLINSNLIAQNYLWTPIGPAPQSSNFFGPVSGRIWGASISPAYTKNGVSHPAMMFIAVDQGGVWRSKDFTSAQPTWEPLFDKQPRLYYAETITVDPFHPNRILVPAGLQMILVSENSGDTWEILEKNVYGSYGPSSRLIIDPTDNTSQTMYGIDGDYAGGTGVFKTTNGGLTWTKLIFPVTRTVHALDYSVSASNDLTLYAGLAASGLWQSTDGGVNWTKMKIDLSDIASAAPIDSTKIGRISITANHDPTNENQVYALITNNSTQKILNAFRVNRNGTWNAIAGNLKNASDYNIDHGLNSSSTFQACGVAENGFFYAAAGDPGYSPIYQKNPEGANWFSVENGTNGFRPHTDIHSFSFYSGKIYATTDGGIYRFNPLSNNRLGRNTWESLNSSTLQTVLVNGIGVHPLDPNIVLNGSQDNGIGLRGNSVWKNTGGGDNNRVMFDPSGPSGNEMYAYYTAEDLYNFFYRSKDGGATWEDKSPPAILAEEANVGWYAPFAFHPDNSSRIVIGIDRIYETTDKGSIWSNAKSQIFSPIGNRPSGKPYGAPANAIAFGKENTIWVAYRGNLFRTTNDGGDGTAGNWLNMNNGVNFGGTIVRILVDPTRPADVFLLVSNNTVWKYQTLFNLPGAAPSFSWRNITSNLPVGLQFFSLAMAPATSNSLRALFTGTAAGVYMSTDNGNSWRKFNNGLPPGWTKDLQYLPSQQLLYAGLYGRGVYRTSVKDVLDKSKQHSISIVQKKEKCDLSAVEGTTIQFGFDIAFVTDNEPTYIKWTIDNALTAPGETFDGREITVTVPLGVADIGIGLELWFADGLKLGRYLQLPTHSEEENSTFHYFCSMMNIYRKKPIPWWQWNPAMYEVDLKTNEIIKRKASREELIKMQRETEIFLKQLKREIEMYR